MTTATGAFYGQERGAENGAGHYTKCRSAGVNAANAAHGAPLRLQEGEDKETFLGRIREALLSTMKAGRPAES